MLRHRLLKPECTTLLLILIFNKILCDNVKFCKQTVKALIKFASWPIGCLSMLSLPLKHLSQLQQTTFWSILFFFFSTFWRKYILAFHVNHLLSRWLTWMSNLIFLEKKSNCCLLQLQLELSALSTLFHDVTRLT